MQWPVLAAVFTDVIFILSLAPLRRLRRRLPVEVVL
jgi:hypothetical protein